MALGSNEIIAQTHINVTKITLLLLICFTTLNEWSGTLSVNSLQLLVEYYSVALSYDNEHKYDHGYS
jgi:hypothetical protein